MSEKHIGPSFWRQKNTSGPLLVSEKHIGFPYGVRKAFEKTVHRLSKTNKNVDSHIYNQNIVTKTFPRIFLYCLKYFGVFKSIDKGVQGSKNPEIIDMLSFGPSHNKTEIY